MLRKLFLSAALTLILLPSMGQLSISGTVIDQANRNPIPYVNIWITGLPYGTSTNDDGNFEIIIPATLDPDLHTISFSSIGYHSKQIPLKDLETLVSVQLVSSVTELSELVILTEKARRKNETTARRLVHRALNQIPKNYPKKPYTLNTFYRHYCSENQNYVRLIEAAVDVYSPKNNFKLEQVPDERLAFRVVQLRRSFDFTENAKLFHPSISLNYLWSNDLTDFKYHNPLADNLEQFSFKISDTTNYDLDRVMVIEFEQLSDQNFAAQSHYRGKLFIVEKDLAFIRTEIIETKVKAGVTDSIHSVIDKKSVYKSFQDNYYLDRLTNDVNVLYADTDSSGVIVDTLRHKSHIEMISNNIHNQQPAAFEGKEPGKLDLRNIKYDSTFWKQYTVLKATTLEQQIIEDLSERISLEKQFVSYNTIDGGGISITDSDLFRELLKAHQGTPLYLVLWSNWGQLNHIDLQPVNYFKRMLKKERVKFLLVAVEHSQDEWLNNRNYYGLNIKYVHHCRLDLGFDSEVARSYFNNVFPYFLSVNTDGTSVFRNPPLPNNQEIKPFLKALINDELLTVPIAKE